MKKKPTKLQLKNFCLFYFELVLEFLLLHKIFMAEIERKTFKTDINRPTSISFKWLAEMD